MSTKAGTPFYVAPQVLRGSYDEKCDVWSCGVICYILLCGVPPFYGETDAVILSSVKKGDYEFPSPEWDGVSPAGKSVIDKMLTLDQEKRPSFETLIKDQWFLMVGSKEEDGSKLHTGIGSNLSKFLTYNKFKKFALTCVAYELDDEQIGKLKHTFQTLDKNKDGTLTIQEIVSGLTQHLKKEDADALLQKGNNLDTDGSGTVDYTEFIAATIEGSSITADACIRAAFKLLDKNGDGFISREELKQRFQEEDSVIEGMMKPFDVDGDGKIDYNEFYEMVKGEKRG